MLIGYLLNLNLLKDIDSELGYIAFILNDQLTIMCTTRGERRLISIRCQKECVESEMVISFLQNDA